MTIRKSAAASVRARELADVLAARLGPLHATAVGVIDADGEALVVGGAATEASAFEIGSVTKTVTGTLLASLVCAGDEQLLSDPISKWLKAGANGDITVEQLATHSSGLPRLAPNADAWDGFSESDPYAGYDASLALAALAAVEPGPLVVEYSNFGFQVLGLVLEAATGEEYAALAEERLFGPLGMASTQVGVDHPQLVRGFQGGEAVGPWRQLLPGAGAVVATGPDMMRYLRAALTPDDSAVGAALRLAMTPRLADGPGSVGLGWQIHPQGLTWHNGGTGGFRSMIALDRSVGQGAFALVNRGDLDELDLAVVLVAAGRSPEPAFAAPSS